MIRKMIATFTAVTAALLVVGVAWASGDDDTSTSVTSAGSSTSTSGDTATSVTSATSASTPTTSGATTSSSDATATTTADSTSTSIGSNSTTSTSLGATTSTSSGSTTSTSSGSSTSTSLDGNGGQAPPDGQSTYSIPGLGNVTIAVRSGSLVLVNITAPGWAVEIDKEETDRIEIEFEKGDAEAEFEARIRGSQIDVKTEVDSD